MPNLHNTGAVLKLGNWPLATHTAHGRWFPSVNSSSSPCGAYVPQSGLFGCHPILQHGG